MVGHSMGGLLAAEAATDSSNNRRGAHTKPNRIIGVIAFDTPYLGMHPHVVITGLASLLPNQKHQGKKTEPQMNPDVNIVDDRVTDDWESYKHTLDGRLLFNILSYVIQRLGSSPSINFGGLELVDLNAFSFSFSIYKITTIFPIPGFPLFGKDTLVLLLTFERSTGQVGAQTRR